MLKQCRDPNIAARPEIRTRKSKCRPHGNTQPEAGIEASIGYDEAQISQTVFLHWQELQEKRKYQAS